MQATPMTEDFGTVLTAGDGETLDDVAKDEVVDLIKDRGTVLFRGFKASKEDFDAFTDRVTGDYMNYRGGGYVRKQVGEDDGKALLSTRYDHGREKQMTFGLPLHGEMYYTDGRPALLWFFCVKPADADGQTTAADGAEIYKRLPQQWKDLLHEKRLMFERTYRDGEWQKIYQTEDADEALSFARENGLQADFDDQRTMRTRYLINAVLPTRWGGHTSYINNLLPVVMQQRMGRGDTSTVRFEDGSEIPEEMMKEVERIQDEVILNLDWGAGDFAIIDNSRALHGRRAFEDTEREVYLRMVRNVDF
jgi:alpha-ketoglutarate-dependent taurine dioxygenase